MFLKQEMAYISLNITLTPLNKEFIHLNKYFTDIFGHPFQHPLEKLLFFL